MAFSQVLGQLLADEPNGSDGLRVVHPGRAQNADRARGYAVDLYRSHNQGALGEWLQPGLGPDSNVAPAVDDIFDQT